jgi:CRISPR-associated endonuclease/helicase Cas3
MAGRWRRVDVRVSDHEAPFHLSVPMLMRDYCRDLEVRIAALGGTLDDRTLEFLAFAEGRLLWIHPFEDFNGRVTRVFLAELLQRLGLPAVDPTPDPGPETERYLQALQAADRADWWPLITLWRERFEKEAQA